jgi:hypothetical protein
MVTEKLTRLFEKIYVSTHDKSEEELLNDAEQAYKYVLEDNSFRRKDGVKVEFTDKGKNELFWSISQVMNNNIGKGATKLLSQDKDILDEVLAVVSKLGEVTEEAEYKFRELNKKPDKKPNVKGYEHFECPVIIDDKERLVNITYEVSKSGKRQFYFDFIPTK